MATDSPKGKAIRMANRLTQSVPVIKGKKPNKGAGVAVGNHSAPANTSFAEMVLSFIKYTESLCSTNCSGTKATIPGVRATNPVIHAPAFS